ncbi:hypothetical protein E4U37_005686 [Claviceps purpurea]|nr:hypothetical protein E4U37_005686 [Claviceps purpurea]
MAKDQGNGEALDIRRQGKGIQDPQTLRRLENAMYLQKTAPGPAIDDDEKLGRQISTLHLTLWQGGQVLFWTMRRGLWPPALAAKCLPLFQAVELAAFTGLSIPTG